MALSLIPWEPHVFPNEIQSELRRRSINRGFNPLKSEIADWKNDNDSWNDYRGPMTSWVRVCSNGVGIEGTNKEGFVMYGGKDFFTSYGFYNADTNISSITSTGFSTDIINNPSIIGYTPNGNPHTVDNDIYSTSAPIHVPSPEIERVSSTIQKELLRQVRIEWTCFSFKQLEYMTPYFLVPGITCIVEYGWNHFNKESLVNLNDLTGLAEYHNNPYPLYINNVLKSRGNYEVVFGYIYNFEWYIDGNKIRCVTEILSKDRLYAGMIVNENLIGYDPALTDKENKDSKGNPSSDSKTNIKVLESLKVFVNENLDAFKDIIDHNKKSDEIVDKYINKPNIEEERLSKIFEYVKKHHPNNYKEYLFGIYYGREKSSKKSEIEGNLDHDWDRQSPKSQLWINMGLIIEIINFFSDLKGVKNEPFFRIDVDDCIISGHPNLISNDGNVLLIPNAISPKIQTGGYGFSKVVAAPLLDTSLSQAVEDVFSAISSLGLSVGSALEYLTSGGKTPYKVSDQKDIKEYETKMFPSDKISIRPPTSDLKVDVKTPSLKWANYRLYQILLHSTEARRDNISNIINKNRFEYADSNGRYEFPFNSDYYVKDGNDLRKYEAYYTGYFKNLYLNSSILKLVLNDPTVRTFSDVIKKIFDKINGASANFWKFKLDGGAGRKDIPYASMKVIDENMTQYSSNEGKIFIFDYYSADGLIKQLNFRPMLSNAQAIRTIYAQNNLKSNKDVVISGENQLLDYSNFKDRLGKNADQTQNKKDSNKFKKSSFRRTMEELQSINPISSAFQVTTKNSEGKEIIYRLAIPNKYPNILSLLLDDNDKEHNPRYIGIMPNIQAEFTIEGIAGIRTFAMFLVRGLPEPYSEKNIVFRVINCTDTIQNGKWTTHIVAGVIPLRGYFASKLGLSPKTDVASTKKT